MRKAISYVIAIALCTIGAIHFYSDSAFDATASTENSVVPKNSVASTAVLTQSDTVLQTTKPGVFSQGASSSTVSSKTIKQIPSWAIGIDISNYTELYKSWLNWSKTQGPGLSSKKEFLAHTKDSLYSLQGFNLEPIAFLLKEDAMMSALVVQDFLTNSEIQKDKLKENFSKLVQLCLLIESTPACKDVHWLYQGYYYYSKEKTLKTLASLVNSYDQCGASAPYLLSQIDSKVSQDSYQENTPWCF